jgi:hypothetical protein
MKRMSSRNSQQRRRTTHGSMAIGWRWSKLLMPALMLLLLLLLLLLLPLPLLQLVVHGAADDNSNSSSIDSNTATRVVSSSSSFSQQPPQPMQQRQLRRSTSSATFTAIQRTWRRIGHWVSSAVTAVSAAAAAVPKALALPVCMNISTAEEVSHYQTDWTSWASYLYRKHVLRGRASSSMTRGVCSALCPTLCSHQPCFVDYDALTTTGGGANATSKNSSNAVSPAGGDGVVPAASSTTAVDTCTCLPLRRPVQCGIYAQCNASTDSCHCLFGGSSSVGGGGRSRNVPKIAACPSGPGDTTPTASPAPALPTAAPVIVDNFPP